MNEDDHLNIRISAKLKQDLKRVLPLYGFNDYSAWVRSCAMKIIENDNSESDMDRGFDLDPDIRSKFFEMMNRRFGIIIARYPKKKVMGMYIDFTRAFYEETSIVLLPLESRLLINQYYSGNYITSDIRKAYEEYIIEMDS